ncbi:MAG TPA: hypothetical protein VGQ96_04080, partial [Candidatus Eremiobacteraceae bacterium]|nr:hypothetical protein [Candidatus Eremiobacteraceae bacterium]
KGSAAKADETKSKAQAVVGDESAARQADGKAAKPKSAAKPRAKTKTSAAKGSETADALASGPAEDAQH